MKKHSIHAFFYLYLCYYHTIFPQFRLGVENISSSSIQNFLPIKKENISAGIITNQTGTDQHSIRTIDILHKKKSCSVKYIFVPEHGLNGISAGRKVPDSHDMATNIPVISLYGNGTGKMLSPEYLTPLDVLIFDIQDSGMRHYTYISTLFNAMKIAAEYNIPFIVLDRPNPLAGLMQGPLVEPTLISFISIASIPLRHGMTIAELARYFNAYVLDKPVQLHVVPMSGYHRRTGFMGPWLHSLSPNIQSLQSCFGYSFLGLLGEIAPFDVGVGTPMAFRCILLPESINIAPDIWKELNKILNTYGVKSSSHKQINPRTQKYSSGISLEITDISRLHSFELFIDVAQLFKQYNLSVSFSSTFDKAVGSTEVKDVIMGTIAKEKFLKKVQMDLQQFRQQAQKVLLYTK